MKIVGMMVCGPGEADRYLEKPLNQFKNLCDDAVICLNGEDPKRDALVKKRGFWSYRDDREWGKFQPNIKTDLLAKIVKMGADWVLPLDADEEMARMDRKTLEEMINAAPEKKHSFFFYFVTLWGDEEHYAPKFGFWNIRLFKPVRALGLHYQKTALHCGLAPPYAYSNKHAIYSKHIVRHYGLITKEDRQAKVERYKKYDPKQIYKNPIYYQWLEEEKISRPYNENDIISKVASMSNQNEEVDIQEKR